MCRDSENLTAAPKFSGVKWTQIYADFGLGFDYATDYTAIRLAWNKALRSLSFAFVVLFCGYSQSSDRERSTVPAVEDAE